MNADLMREVEEAYAKTARLTALERASLLSEVYPDRPDIIHEVESLVKYQNEAGKIDHSIIVAAAAEMFQSQEDELIGVIVAGTYAVRSCIGSGGMANVYLADH